VAGAESSPSTSTYLCTLGSGLDSPGHACGVPVAIRVVTLTPVIQSLFPNKSIVPRGRKFGIACLDYVDVGRRLGAPPLSSPTNIPHPPIPNALQAVFPSPAQGQKPFIDLTWNANTDADLTGYSVYLRREGMGFSPREMQQPNLRQGPRLS